jgi:autotransporter-associated beta strand protein
MPSAYAQTFIWQPSNPLQPFWSLSENWVGGIAPTSGMDTRLDFGQSDAEIVAANDIGTFTLNALTIGTTPSVSGPLSITLLPMNFATNSIAVLPTLTQNATKAVSLANNLTLSNLLTIGGTGSGTLSLTGILSGTGGLVINRQVALTQANTYTGGTTLNVDFGLSANNALPSTGNVTINNVTLRLNSFNQTLENITFGNGSLSGGTILGGSGGVLTLTGDMFYNGPANGDGASALIRNTGLVLSAGNHTLGLSGTPLDDPNTAAFIFDDVITGSGGLTVDGSEIISGLTVGNSAEFFKVNTYTGATNVTGGASLYLAVAQAIGVTGTPLTVEAGSTVVAQRKADGVLQFHDQTFGSIAGGGTIRFGDADLIIGGNNTNTTFSGTLDGTSGSLTKVGVGVLTLAGTSTYTAPTVIRGGTLRMGADNPLPINGDIRLINGTLDTGTSQQTINNISFFGGLGQFEPQVYNPVAVTGTGTLTLAGNILLNRPQTSALAPAVQWNANLILPTGNHTVSHNVLTLPDVDYEIVFGGVISGTGGLTFTNPAGADGFSVALTNQNTYTGDTTLNAAVNFTAVYLGTQNALPRLSAVTIIGSSAIFLNPTITSDGVVAGNYSQNIGSLSGNGALSLGSANLTTGHNNTNTTFSGAISGVGGSLTKVGTGTFTLTGLAKTYTGATTIDGGTLLVNTNITASSEVVVNNGGTLGGTGVLPAITLNAGGIIAPGNSPGTLTALSLVWNGGGILNFEQGDLLVLSGDLKKGTPGAYRFDFSSAGLRTDSILDLIFYGTTDFQASDFSFINAPIGIGGRFTLEDGILRFEANSAPVAAPEPTSWVLLAMTLLGIATAGYRKSKT